MSCFAPFKQGKSEHLLVAVVVAIFIVVEVVEVAAIVLGSTAPHFPHKIGQ